MDAERKEMILKIEDISKKFGKTTILSGISMEKARSWGSWALPGAENPRCLV